MRCVLNECLCEFVRSYIRGLRRCDGPLRLDALHISVLRQSRFRMTDASDGWRGNRFRRCSRRVMRMTPATSHDRAIWLALFYLVSVL
jgi:hypothetical protein